MHAVPKTVLEFGRVLFLTCALLPCAGHPTMLIVTLLSGGRCSDSPDSTLLPPSSLPRDAPDKNTALVGLPAPACEITAHTARDTQGKQQIIADFWMQQTGTLHLCACQSLLVHARVLSEAGNAWMIGPRCTRQEHCLSSPASTCMQKKGSYSTCYHHRHHHVTHVATAHVM
jgi:hypothetical protein